MTARKGPEERRRLRGERPRSTAAMLFAPCPRASARRDALNDVFSLTLISCPRPGARGTGCRRIAEPGDRPVTALRRKTRPFVKYAYGSCARVRGGERSALCPMVCAHGLRQDGRLRGWT